MKKNMFKIVMGLALIATISSCTKEQTSLNLLKGTWTLDKEFDDDGIQVVVTDPDVASRVSEITFFECNGKDNDPCTGYLKTVTTYNDNSPTNINATDFSYSVHDKEVLILSGTVFNIDELSKKNFKISRASEPLERYEYSR